MGILLDDLRLGMGTHGVLHANFAGWLASHSC